MKEITLFDSEQQKTFKLNISEENYDEIILRGNLDLATTLLQAEQEKQNFIAAFNVVRGDSQLSSASSGDPNTGTVTTIDADTGESPTIQESNSMVTELETLENAKIWTDQATRLLINLCKKFKNEFETGIKRYVWNKVARMVTEECKQVYTSQQCDTKWKGLKTMYKQVKKHNEKSGNDLKVWKYFDIIDEILFGRPEINARATCSSKKGLIVNATPSQAIGCIVGDTTSVPLNNLNEEPSVDDQKTPTFSSSFKRKRRNFENAADRRHNEKMVRQDRFLDLLERLTTAVEKNNGSGEN